MKMTSAASCLPVYTICRIKTTYCINQKTIYRPARTLLHRSPGPLANHRSIWLLFSSIQIAASHIKKFWKGMTGGEDLTLGITSRSSLWNNLLQKETGIKQYRDMGADGMPFSIQSREGNRKLADYPEENSAVPQGGYVDSKSGHFNVQRCAMHAKAFRSPRTIKMTRRKSIQNKLPFPVRLLRLQSSKISDRGRKRRLVRGDIVHLGIGIDGTAGREHEFRRRLNTARLFPRRIGKRHKAPCSQVHCERQIAGFDNIVFRQHEGTPKLIAQLPDVSRP